MDFVITSQQIVWICGFIASIWGVVKIIKELKKPSDDLRAKVQRHDELEYIKLDRDKSTFKSHRDFSSEKEITFKHS